MPISQISSLSKPHGAWRIEPWEFAYFQARNRSRAHDLVLREFEKSRITKADLARRMGKRPEIVSRLLATPGNWGLNTFSDLLFAISGAEPAYDVQYPLDGKIANYRFPEWLVVTARTSTVQTEGVTATFFWSTNLVTKTELGSTFVYHVVR